MAPATVRVPAKKALVLLLVAAWGAVAGPLAPRQEVPAASLEESATRDPCATIRCASPSVCNVVDGRGVCVEKCGTTVCAAGLVCCNPTCNMCVKPGMMCTQQVCNLSELPPTLPSVVQPPGKRTTPTLTVVAPKPTTIFPPPGGEKCGDWGVVCPAGETCCNPSCGTCVKPGSGCTKQLCAPPPSAKCGKVLCPAGQECCNSSCGICTPPGGFCTQQFCEA